MDCLEMYDCGCAYRVGGSMNSPTVHVAGLCHSCREKAAQEVDAADWAAAVAESGMSASEAESLVLGSVPALLTTETRTRVRDGRVERLVPSRYGRRDAFGGWVSENTQWDDMGPAGKLLREAVRV